VAHIRVSSGLLFGLLVAYVWHFQGLLVVQIWKTGADRPSAIIPAKSGPKESVKFVPDLGHINFAIWEFFKQGINFNYTNNLYNLLWSFECPDYIYLFLLYFFFCQSFCSTYYNKTHPNAATTVWQPWDIRSYQSPAEKATGVSQSLHHRNIMTEYVQLQEKVCEPLAESVKMLVILTK